MNSFKFLICFALVVFATAETENLRDLTAYNDYASFAAGCVATGWGSSNQNCFNVKLAGYQCCAGTLQLAGLAVTTCYPQGGTSSSSSSSGVAGVASVSYVCSSGFLQISMILAFIMMLFL